MGNNFSAMFIRDVQENERKKKRIYTFFELQFCPNIFDRWLIEYIDDGLADTEIQFYFHSH